MRTRNQSVTSTSLTMLISFMRYQVLLIHVSVFHELPMSHGGPKPSQVLPQREVWQLQGQHEACNMHFAKVSSQAIFITRVVLKTPTPARKREGPDLTRCPKRTSDSCVTQCEGLLRGMNQPSNCIGSTCIPSVPLDPS